MGGLGSFSSFHVVGEEVGKNLYLFSGIHSWIFRHCALNAGHSLSAAPCPMASASTQLVQQKAAVSVMGHCAVQCGLPQHAQMSVVVLHSVA
jgi:hypothetical protein